jgi:hypothetical protein
VPKALIRGSLPLGSWLFHLALPYGRFSVLLPSALLSYGSVSLRSFCSRPIRSVSFLFFAARSWSSIPPERARRASVKRHIQNFARQGDTNSAAKVLKSDLSMPLRRPGLAGQNTLFSFRRSSRFQRVLSCTLAPRAETLIFCSNQAHAKVAAPKRHIKTCAAGSSFALLVSAAGTAGTP